MELQCDCCPPIASYGGIKIQVPSSAWKAIEHAIFDVVKVELISAFSLAYHLRC